MKKKIVIGGGQMMNPPHQEATLYVTPHLGLMAKKEKNVASESESEGKSESESEDESDDDEFNQHLAWLSKKDKLMVLKLIDKIDEQEETLHKQEDFLIEKIKHFTSFVVQ